MAIETVAAERGESPDVEFICIPERRRLLALESVWEIDALSSQVRDLCDVLGAELVDQTELMRLRLKIRGITLRIETLNSAAMSILDDDDDTSSLERKIFGLAAAQELRHG